MYLSTVIQYIRILLIAFSLCFFCQLEIFGQGGSYTYRQVAVLDLTERNSEIDSSRTRSVRHIMQVTGVPFVETTDFNFALQHKILFIAPRIYSSTFSDAEELALHEYVYNGGTVIASNCSAPDLYDLFGVVNYEVDDLTKRFIWNIYSESNYFDRINEDKEIFVSLGDTAVATPIFDHKYYFPAAGAEVLANYENNFPALIKNDYGTGTTFLFGVDLKDVIARNLLNKDDDAHRTYSNGFEPTTDTFIFFVMNVCRKHIPSNVRWHTCPSCDDAVFMLTHDIDSQTAVDTMGIFLEYEDNHHLNAMYNQTVRYVNDDWMSAFYVNNSYAKVHNVLIHHQRLASHSVGHFPDFDSVWTPMGSMGNNMADYVPYYSAELGRSIGTTAYGECEVSKKIIENDHGVQVKSFRAGHLSYHKRLPKVLEDLGYLYNSTFSANDVLTNFPFYGTDRREFSGYLSSVIEIPMTISDASATFPFSLDSYPSNVARWKSVTLKNVANGAPTVLLIHPNRSYKLIAEQNFFSQLPYGIRYMFLDDFGDYWRERINSRLYSDYNPADSTMGVYLMDFNIEKEYAVIIDNYVDSAHCKFYDGFGNRLYPCITPGPFDEFRFCNFQYNPNNDSYCNMPYTVGIENSTKKKIQIYPNPASNEFTFECAMDDIGKNIQIFDGIGKVVYDKKIERISEKIDITKFSPGIYSVRFDELIYKLIIE
jgi:hypothetical protein